MLDRDGIVVTGHGSVGATPDVASLTMGVAPVRRSVAEGMAAATAKMRAVIDALAAGGVSSDDMQTRRFTIGPEYDHQRDVARLRGFRVDHRLTATVRDLSALGELLDAAVAAAGEDVRVDAIRFALDDDRQARERARELAWRDADGRARQLAALAGVTLGPAVSITEGGGFQPPVAAGALRAAAAAPIEPGEVDIAVSLTVQFSLTA